MSSAGHRCTNALAKSMPILRYDNIHRFLHESIMPVARSSSDIIRSGSGLNNLFKDYSPLGHYILLADAFRNQVRKREDLRLSLTIVSSENIS